MAKKFTVLEGERLIPIFDDDMHVLIYHDIRRNGCIKKKQKKSCPNNLKLHVIEALYKCFLLLKDERLIPNIDRLSVYWKKNTIYPNFNLAMAAQRSTFASVHRDHPTDRP